MPKKIIYYVEDEKHIQELVKFNVEANGYIIKTFDSGIPMLEECKNQIPSLIILDIMLPDIDGLEILRRIKSDFSLQKIPVIMLSAKSEEFDKILGLELGADDYITKPFSVRELITRIKVLFRRIENSENNEIDDKNQIKCGEIIINFDSRSVVKNGKNIELSYKEFELLKMLITNKGKVLSRDVLLEKVWGFDYYGETRTVDVHIRYLRQKIEDDANKPEYIETVRGIGYRFNYKQGAKN